MFLLKKCCIYIILILLCNGTLFALTPNTESLQIRNHTTKCIKIKKEFKINTPDRRWLQTIDGIELQVQNIPHNCILPPSEFFNILSYYPYYELGFFSEYYEKLDDIPILDKVNAILNVLLITDIDGNVLLDLDNLREENIRKDISNKQNYYIIDIYDKDFY
jgi:hypothetical protein